MRRSRPAARASQPDYDEVVSAVYEAALGSVPWEAVLPRIARFVGAHRAGLGFRARGAQAEFLLSFNLDPGLIARWNGEFSGHDPWCESFADRRRPGELLHGGSEAIMADVRETDVYTEIYGPLGLDDLIAITLAAEGNERAYLSVYRDRSEGLFDDGAVARARLLAPHLVRGAAIQERIGGLGQEAAAAKAVLECVPYGVLLLDVRRSLVWANREGERLLVGDSLLTVRSGAVHARDPSIDARLAAACAAAGLIAEGGEARPGARIPIARSATGRLLEIMVVPVGPQVRAASLSFSARRVRVALVLADPTAATSVHADAVGDVLHLPPSLARLATAITSGMTVANYAAEAGVTEGTARQQLKDLFARVGVSRQADLVRVVLRSIAALSLPDPS